MKVRFYIQPDGETFSLPIVAKIAHNDLKEMLCATLEPYTVAWDGLHKLDVRQFGKLLKTLFPSPSVVDFCEILEAVSSHFETAANQ